ncbi:unnamed protein product [Prorocentrum cordatum]|uniref:Calcium-activated potassium channel BK alpha subunit domain-containing protein n=1 Tax=Prorocentrum cordatum TaxID=2364126 RepID=A0ABN9T7G3_9DINO|nr:unnamed protein product [Polarella glacialis]
MARVAPAADVASSPRCGSPLHDSTRVPSKNSPNILYKRSYTAGAEGVRDGGTSSKNSTNILYKRSASHDSTLKTSMSIVHLQRATEPGRWTARDWYESNMAMSCRRFIRGRFFSFLTLICLFNALFLYDAFIVLQVYWIVETMSTVGYGDYAPTTFLSRLVTMVCMVAGVVFFTYQLGRIQMILVKHKKGTGAFTPSKGKEHVILIGGGVRKVDETLLMAFLEELYHKSYRNQWPELVVMTSLVNSMEKMRELVDRELDWQARQNVHFMVGSPLSLADLERCRCDSATLVFIIADTSGINDPHEDLRFDKQNILRALSVKNSFPGLPFRLMLLLSESKEKAAHVGLRPQRCFSVNQMRSCLFWQACRCKGWNTLLCNLMVTRDADEVDSAILLDAPWLEEYLLGLGHEVYGFLPLPELHGKSIRALTKDAFRRFGILVIGAQIHGRIVLAPIQRHDAGIIRGGTVLFALAQDEDDLRDIAVDNNTLCWKDVFTEERLQMFAQEKREPSHFFVSLDSLDQAIEVTSREESDNSHERDSCGLIANEFDGLEESDMGIRGGGGRRPARGRGEPTARLGQLLLPQSALSGQPAVPADLCPREALSAAGQPRRRRLGGPRHAGGPRAARGCQEAVLQQEARQALREGPDRPGGGAAGVAARARGRQRAGDRRRSTASGGSSASRSSLVNHPLGRRGSVLSSDSDPISGQLVSTLAMRAADIRARAMEAPFVLLLAQRSWSSAVSFVRQSRAGYLPFDMPIVVLCPKVPAQDVAEALDLEGDTNLGAVRGSASLASDLLRSGASECSTIVCVGQEAEDESYLGSELIPCWTRTW